MGLTHVGLSISTRRKLASIVLVVIIFVLLTGLLALLRGRQVVFGVLDGVFVGVGVGLFEQFYVQSARGRWFRNIHPLRSIIIYTIVVAVLLVTASNIAHLLLRGVYNSPVPYGRLILALPQVIAIAVFGIVVMRAVHFIGIETLFHLMIGTYHRPVIRKRVIVFLDINDSTSLAERLGAVRMQSLAGKFLFDISRLVTDYGGEIYLYKGDGLIALWDWQEAILASKILRAIDAMFANVRSEQKQYQKLFGVVPTFRIGVHGGDVVVSEQGDTKRSIGIYGITINIASRMEEAAKAHQVRCAISGDVAQALGQSEDRLHLIGSEKIKGISAEIPIFEYRVGPELVELPLAEGVKLRYG